MKPQTRKRYILLATVLLVVAGLMLPCFLYVKHEQHQYAMNRELIQSLKQGDFKQSLKLVETGADPNTRTIPPSPPTWLELLKQLLYHSKPLLNRSPTAFMLGCGDAYHNPMPPALAQEMLEHGADINARDERGATALMTTTRLEFTDSMIFLLRHHAALDIQDDEGDTAVHYAIIYGCYDALELLLKNHANVRIKEKSGMTPLVLTQSRRGRWGATGRCGPR